MRMRWLLCVLLGAMAWAQASTGTTTAPPGSAKAPNGNAPANQPEAKEVPEDAAVLTITGVCPSTAGGEAHKSSTAAKAGGTTGKTTEEKKKEDCKTVITRKEFDKIASDLQSGPTPLTQQQKRQLANVLPRFMAMSEVAKEKGLDKTPQFKETLKLATMQILTNQLQHSIQAEAENVPPEEIEAYYKKNPEAFEQFSLDRLFIPRFKQAAAADRTNQGEEKLTEEQRKTKEADDQKKQEEGAQELTKLSDSLRERAAAGEDFIKLQKEAFEAANMRMDSPTVSMKVRRTGLPPAHVAVFDLKVGEVSQVITDNGGHYIYKVVSKETLPLDQVKDEIRNTLKTQRMKEMMDKYTNSYHAETNEAYFGPPGPPGGPMGGRPMPRTPRPNMPPPSMQPQGQPQSAPPAATPPTQSPAQPSPPSNSN